MKYERYPYEGGVQETLNPRQKAETSASSSSSTQRVVDHSGHTRAANTKPRIAHGLIEARPLIRSSIMGLMNEHSSVFLDHVLQHMILIPLYGRILQTHMDVFACKMGSDLLVEFTTIPIKSLAKKLKARILAVVTASYKDTPFESKENIQSILLDRYGCINKLLLKVGFETQRELVKRLLTRLDEIIPWEISSNPLVVFRTKDREPQINEPPVEFVDMTIDRHGEHEDPYVPPTQPPPKGKGKGSKGKSSKGGKHLGHQSKNWGPNRR